MGVDYYSCQNCQETYPDCGDYFTCTGCESNFCSTQCGGRKVEAASTRGSWDDKTSCVLCRKEVITDSDMVIFLLRRLGITRLHAEEIFRDEDKPSKPSSWT